MPPEERQRRMRAIFGLEPEPPKTPEENDEEKAAKIRDIYGLPPKPTEPPAEPETDGHDPDR